MSKDGETIMAVNASSNGSSREREMKIDVQELSGNLGSIQSRLHYRRATLPVPLPSLSSNSTPRSLQQSTSSSNSTPHISSLAFPPPTAHWQTNQPFPSPVPLLQLTAGQIPPSVRRQSLQRRRSSFPPTSGTPGASSANIFPWVIGGTPGAGSFEFGAGLDSFPGFGNELVGSSSSSGGGMNATSGVWPSSNGWEGLLSFEVDPITSKLITAKPDDTYINSSTSAIEPERTRSDPSSNLHTVRSRHSAPPLGSSTSGNSIEQFSNLVDNPVARYGSEIAWKTILGSMVEVETIGQVGVVRILREVWSRGGGDVVTSLCLWPSIVIALSSTASSNPHSAPHPSAHASLALQTIYNLTLRPWEPSIFSGLLAAYAASSLTPQHSSHPLTVPITKQDDMSTPTPQNVHEHTSIGVSSGIEDYADWMNVTPDAEWSNLAGFFGSTGLTPQPPKHDTPSANRQSSALSRSTIPTYLDIEDERSRRSSTSHVDNGDAAGITGLDEILALMEDTKEEQERALEEANMATFQGGSEPLHLSLMESDDKLVNDESAREEVENVLREKAKQRSTSMFQLPTPPNDSSSSPAGSGNGNQQNSSSLVTTIDLSRPNNSKRKENVQELGNTATSIAFSPSSMASSPNVSANSTNSLASSTVSATSQTLVSSVSSPLPLSLTNNSSSAATSRQPHPTHVVMPSVPFVPPPPMCMFFSPAFKDLQKGKVGVWKGDLEVRGRGGGKFSVLIVGEEGTSHVWQSNHWPETISYPAEPGLVSSSCTSSMIPVANLAREGYMPVAMGMVLCNDDRISEYVSMVQGLHSEGVAFHLPGLAKLPIVFLPAKFDSNDTLQRLGIAFMSKDRVLPPAPVNSSLVGKEVKRETCQGDETVLRKKKQRRQSSVSVSSGGGMGNRKRSNTIGKRGKIDEEVIED